VAQALGMDIARYWNDGGGSLRVFNAAQTYFLATAFLIAFYSYLNKTGPKWWGGLLPLLLVCIVVLQHRTLWVVTVVSIGVFFLASGKIRSKAVSTFLVAALVGAAVLVPLFTGGKLDTVQQSLVHSVQEVGQENSTMAWRVQSWRALVEQWAHGGPVVNLIGYPFGSGYERHIEVTQKELTQSPHSQYVTVLIRTGMVGIVAMLAVYYLAIKSMRRINSHASSQTVDSKLLLALLIGQLAYFITYSVHYSQLIPLGLSLVMLGHFRRQPTKDEGAPMLSGATQGVSGSRV
jgi:O-antigen ligase